MEMRIHKDIAGETTAPILLVGWPGMGSVAIGPPITNDDGHLEMVLIDPDGNEIVAWEDTSE